jgi:hypothetical protein
MPVLPSQVRVCVPQLPHAWLGGPEHTWPVQEVAQWQVASQVCVPPEPQARVAVGAQSPSAVHAPHAEYMPVLPSQVRERVPQLPHASVAGPTQGWPVQAAPHWQVPSQVWVPPEPQARVAFGAHAP